MKKVYDYLGQELNIGDTIVVSMQNLVAENFYRTKLSITKILNIYGNSENYYLLKSLDNSIYLPKLVIKVSNKIEEAITLFYLKGYK